MVPSPRGARGTAEGGGGGGRLHDGSLQSFLFASSEDRCGGAGAAAPSTIASRWSPSPAATRRWRSRNAARAAPVCTRNGPCRTAADRAAGSPLKRFSPVVLSVISAAVSVVRPTLDLASQA